MPAAISMYGIKTLDKMHVTRSQRNYQQQQNGGNKERYMILNCTKNFKLTGNEKRTQTRKLRRFLTKSKGCRADEICHWSTM